MHPRPRRPVTDRTVLTRRNLALQEMKRSRMTRRATRGTRRATKTTRRGTRNRSGTRRDSDEDGDDPPGNSGNAPGQNKVGDDDDDEGGSPGSSGETPGHDDDSPGNSAYALAAPRAAEWNEGHAAGSSRGRGQSRATCASPRIPGGALLGAHPRNRRCDASRLHPPLRANASRGRPPLCTQASRRKPSSTGCVLPISGPISKGRRRRLDRILTARARRGDARVRRSRQLTAASFARRRSQGRAPLPDARAVGRGSRRNGRQRAHRDRGQGSIDEGFPGLTRRSASRTARSACSSWTRTTGR